MNIKQYKPKKGVRYKQGYINPESCKKLFENQRNTPIIYRSSWEKRFMQWCEYSKDVKHWGSECASIPYFLPTDNKWHTYYPDFVMEKTNGQIYIVEIKPYNQVEKPNCEDNTYAMSTWIKNISKWNTIKKACDERGYKFIILTENTINRL